MKRAIYHQPGLRVTVNYSTADDFKETDHPRAKDGKFGAGAGSAPPHPKFAYKAPHATMGKLAKTGGQLGSNEGGKYSDATGKEFYAKKSKSAQHQANEVLAGHLYVTAGQPITNSHAVDYKGSPGTISEWKDHEEKFDPGNKEHIAEIRKGFAVHAWLANWDAIGTGNDNQVKINGKMHTVDAGGAMEFRAQGGAKTFGPDVPELKTLRDPKMNKWAAHVFKDMTKEDMAKSAGRIAHIPDNAIRAQVERHGHGDNDKRKKLADTLIARKQFILKELGWKPKPDAAP